MEWERYEVSGRSNGLIYKFYSEGPKGRILKRVEFQPVPELGRHVYNVAFGDYNATTDRIDDKTVSGNGDREVILHTVADAIIEFMDRKPLAIILIKGSSGSRIRLYQVGLKFYWPKIKEQYQVLGKINNQWLPFQMNNNYEEFVIFKKIG
jgi:hypothetical protein